MFLEFLRDNPAALAVLFAVSIALLVFGVLAYGMLRAGVSLRPLIFLAVFFGIIGGPQAAYHLGTAFGWIPQKDLVWVPASERAPRHGYAEQEATLATENGRFADRAAVFGPEADPSLVSDLRTRGVPPFGGAEVAEMVILPPSGATSIVARYPDAPSALRAAAEYLMYAYGTRPPVSPDGSWTVRRPVGDFAKVLVAGRTLLVFTGPEAAVLDARLRASRVVTTALASGESNGAGATAARAAEEEVFWLHRTPVLVGLTILLLAAAVLWFFKGSTWAASIPARPVAQPLAEHELRQRLLAVNSLEVPFTVAEERNGRRLMVTWRFTDAKWMDLARAHGTRYTHRILLEFDPASRTVRPTEQQTRLDWSAGAGGASLRWVTRQGIMFFQYEHRRVFGLQLDEHGRLVPRLSHSYTFDLQEMKAPFIAAVTEAGWQWRPTVWHGPSWLRWLTN